MGSSAEPRVPEEACQGLDEDEMASAMPELVLKGGKDCRVETVSGTASVFARGCWKQVREGVHVNRVVVGVLCEFPCAHVLLVDGDVLSPLEPVCGRVVRHKVPVGAGDDCCAGGHEGQER